MAAVADTAKVMSRRRAAARHYPMSGDSRIALGTVVPMMSYVDTCYVSR